MPDDGPLIGFKITKNPSVTKRELLLAMVLEDLFVFMLYKQCNKFKDSLD